MFIFDYTIKDWKERKDIVDKYIKENKLIEKIEELVVQNTVPKKIDKNGKVSEWYVQGNSELRELELLLNKMYNYILYAYDKTLFKDSNMTEEQRKVLEDNQNGIKSYVDPRKRGKKTYYKESKWAIIDNEMIKKNQEKVDKFNEYMGKIIDEQIKSYEKLKEEVKNMDKKHLEQMKISKQEVVLELLTDTSICNDSKESINEVCISEGMRSRHDKLSDADIKYDKKTVRTILKYWRDIENVVYDEPNSYLFCIYLDFKKAFETVKLTDYQSMVLNKIINNEDIRNYSSIVKKVVDKFIDELGD